MSKGSIIASARRSIGMTESTLAGLCLMSVRSLRAIEAGTARPHTFAVLSRALICAGAKI